MTGSLTDFKFEMQLATWRIVEKARSQWKFSNVFLYFDFECNFYRIKCCHNL
jgi:hypothetical protein